MAQPATLVPLERLEGDPEKQNLNSTPQDNENNNHDVNNTKRSSRKKKKKKKKDDGPLGTPQIKRDWFHDPRKRIGRDFDSWNVGSVITTPQKGTKLIIAQRIDDGHAGVVFKVRNEADNKIYALKVPKKETEKQFRKLHQEVEKNSKLEELSLPHARIVEEGGDYLVKEWVDGLRGDEWFIKWNMFGRPLDDKAWLKLTEMFDSLSARGIYVQNLKDLNVIFNGTEWVVIDVGYFKHGMSPPDALGRFYETFDGRWNKPKYAKGNFMIIAKETERCVG